MSLTQKIRPHSPRCTALALTLLAAASTAATSAAQVPSNGLRVFLRSDVGITTTSEGRVSAWREQSPAKLDFAQSVDARRPALAREASGATHLRFDGGQYLDGQVAHTFAQATVFALFRPRRVSSSNEYVYSIGDRGSSGSQICLSRRSGDKAYHYDGSLQNIGPGVLPFGRWMISRQVVGRTSATSHELYGDGVQLMSTQARGAYAAAGSRFQVGGWYTGYGHRGDLRALLAYDRVLSATEIASVEAWLGTLYGGAAILSIGEGCPGSGGKPDLQANTGSAPRLGTVFAATTSQLPTTANTLVLFALGFTDAEYSRIALPLALGSAGFTGCTLRVSLDILDPRVASAGSANWSIAIPTQSELLGASFHLQTLCLDAPANPAGITLSNQLALTIGR